MDSVAQEIFNSQPFSALLGAKLQSCGRGRTEISLFISPSLLQHHCYVHGGVLAYLADNALTFAAGSVLGDVVTSEFKINFLQPAQGEMLIAVAEVLSSTTAQAVCRCDIFVVKEDVRSLCASAQGTVRAKEAKRSELSSISVR